MNRRQKIPFIKNRGGTYEKVNVTYAILYDKTNEKILMVKTKGKMFLIIHYQVAQLN